MPDENKIFKDDALAARVLEKIGDEKIEPRARWRFVLKDKTALLSAAFFFGFSITALSAFVFALLNAGWETRTLTHQSALAFLLSAVPPVWLVLTAGSFLIAYEIYRRTKDGYRASLSLVIALGLLAAFTGAAVVYATGYGQVIEEDLGGRMPLYHPVMHRQMELWTRPEAGLISGEILETDPRKTVVRVRDFDGVVWDVPVEEMDARSREVARNFRLVRVIGETAFETAATSIRLFHPCFVLPWTVHGMRPFMSAPRRAEPLPPFTAAPLSENASERSVSPARNIHCKSLQINPSSLPYE